MTTILLQEGLIDILTLKSFNCSQFVVLKRQFLIFIFSDLKKHDLKSFKLLKKMWNMEPVIEVDREAFRDGDLPS